MVPELDEVDDGVKLIQVRTMASSAVPERPGALTAGDWRSSGAAVNSCQRRTCRLAAGEDQRGCQGGAHARGKEKGVGLGFGHSRFSPETEKDGGGRGELRRRISPVRRHDTEGGQGAKREGGEGSYRRCLTRS